MASTGLIADDPKPLILRWPIPVVCSVARTRPVNASNEQTNIRTSAKSNEGGNYTNRATEGRPLFAAGSGSGFHEFVAANIVLAARDEPRVDAKLEVGSISAGSTLILQTVS